MKRVNNFLLIEYLGFSYLHRPATSNFVFLNYINRLAYIQSLMHLRRTCRLIH